MNIVIVGAGEVGSHLGESLVTESHNIFVVEQSESVVNDLQDKLDAHVVCGSGNSVAALEEAMIAEADVLLALTSDDSANLVTSSMAKALGAKQTLCRVHGAIQREEWLFNYREHFHIDYLFSSERLAAIELAKFIRNPDSLLVEEFARGRIELQQVDVGTDSSVIGCKLAELKLPERVRVGMIERGSRQFVPGAQDAIEAGDRVTVFGEPRRLEELSSMLRVKRESAGQRNVVVFGGTETGVALAQMLESGGYKVRVFESDKKRCAALAQLLQETVIINADATSLPHLREERVGEADFFVAATDQDEDNVMTCLQASNLGTRHTLALIHRADYADAIQRTGKVLGILGAVSPREAVRRDLMRFMTPQGHRRVLGLGNTAEVIETKIPAYSVLAEKTVGEIKWPRACGLVALLRGQNALVPSARDMMKPGDTIYAIVTDESRSEFNALLQKQ